MVRHLLLAVLSTQRNPLRLPSGSWSSVFLFEAQADNTPLSEQLCRMVDLLIVEKTGLRIELLRIATKRFLRESMTVVPDTRAQQMDNARYDQSFETLERNLPIGKAGQIREMVLDNHQSMNWPESSV